MASLRQGSLLAWIAAACVGFVVAPAPAAPPAMTDEEIGAIQRGIDRVVEDTRAWQRERGDMVRPWAEAEGHLAIIIDDVGRELHLFEQLLGLRFRLTFSVLPGAVYAPGAQLRLRGDRRRYREIMLHLPMEPLDPTHMQQGAEAREDFLRLGDDHEALRGKLEAALAVVPTAIGVNNHMGSRLTADAAAMDTLMPILRARGLYFVDSRTTAATTAEAAARRAGVPVLARAVFLDDDPSEDAIDRALAQAALASRERPVVAIAHPSPAVVRVLETRLPELWRQGVAIYPVSDLLRAAAEPARAP